MNVTTYRLKYYPFPKDKKRKEYIIGEALLKDKKMPEDELKTLKSIDNDPPDLAVNTKDYEQLRIEVTEIVPHARAAIAQANRFLEKLRGALDKLGTRPTNPLNIYMHRDNFLMPQITQKQVSDIASWIDSECKKPASQKVRTKIDLDTSPFKLTASSSKPTAKFITGSPSISISIIPAKGAFAYPLSLYENNLFLHDITGFPINHEEIKQTFVKSIKNKSSSPADILILFAGLGMLGFNGISEEIKNQLSNLSFSGIYIVQIAAGKNEYTVNTTTVREHPKFKVKK